MGDPSQIGRRHAIDQRDLVVDALDLTQEQLLVRQPEGHTVGRLELQSQAALGELLGPRELFRGHFRLTQRAQLRHRGVDRVGRLARIDSDVDAEVAGVAVLLREAVHVVSETQTLADVQEKTRAHALAEHRVQKVECVTIRMHVAERASTKTDVRLLRVSTPHEDARTVQRRRR